VFCPKCGSIMVPRRKGDRTVLVCPRCGYEVDASKSNPAPLLLKRRVQHRKEVERTYVIDVEEIFKGVPKMRGVKCPKCGHDEAYYKIIQTRRADEPPTRIYKCTKCGHVWREYE